MQGEQLLRTEDEVVEQVGCLLSSDTVAAYEAFFRFN